MRNFNGATRAKLTRKPGTLDECRLVEFHGEDLAAMPLEVFGSGLRGLEELCACAVDEDQIEFAAVEQYTGTVYLVNTEGAQYARYVGRLARRDADALLEAQAEAGVAL